MVMTIVKASIKLLPTAHDKSFEKQNKSKVKRERIVGFLCTVKMTAT